jgi:hypothetical protein
MEYPAHPLLLTPGGKVVRMRPLCRKEVQAFMGDAETLLTPLLLGAPLTPDERTIVEYYATQLLDRFGRQSPAPKPQSTEKADSGSPPPASEDSPVPDKLLSVLVQCIVAYRRDAAFRRQ